MGVPSPRRRMQFHELWPFLLVGSGTRQCLGGQPSLLVRDKSHVLRRTEKTEARALRT